MRMRCTLAAAWGTSAECCPFSEWTASNAALLGRVVVSPHSDVVWLEPHRYCLVATKVTLSYASSEEDGVTNVAEASHGSPTWTGAIRGTVSRRRVLGRLLSYSTHLLQAARCMC